MAIGSLSGVRARGVNWLGLVTLWRIEMARPLRAPVSWFLAPGLTTIVYFAVLAVAAPADAGTVAGVDFLTYAMPALVMAIVVQGAFETTAWSLIDRRIGGTIVDVLMPPLGTAELLVGFAASGITRGLALGVLVLAALTPFVAVRPAGLPLALAFAVLGALVLALIGILGGVWAQKYDHLASVENFVIVPLAFLSGSFYDVRVLAEPWATLSQINPMTHALGGFRAALTGAEGGDVRVAFAVLLLAALGLGLACYRVLERSPKLKP